MPTKQCNHCAAEKDKQNISEKLALILVLRLLRWKFYINRWNYLMIPPRFAYPKNFTLPNSVVVPDLVRERPH